MTLGNFNLDLVLENNDILFFLNMGKFLKKRESAMGKMVVLNFAGQIGQLICVSIMVYLTVVQNNVAYPYQFLSQEVMHLLIDC